MKIPLEKAIELLRACWAAQTEQSEVFIRDVEEDPWAGPFVNIKWEDAGLVWAYKAWVVDNREVEVSGDIMFLVVRDAGENALEEKPLELRLLVPMDLEAACQPVRSERVPDPMKIDEVMFLAQGPCNPKPFLTELEMRWEEGDKGSGVMRRVFWYLAHLAEASEGWHGLGMAPGEVGVKVGEWRDRLYPGGKEYNLSEEYASLEQEWQNEKQ